MDRSPAEQEREMNDLISRAKRNPDRTGLFRHDILDRLIDLTHSPHPELKILAAQNLRFFLLDFPQLEEAAIDAIYDLCEDQSSKVRVEGYAAITEASRVNKKWVRRNADVLLQLLQSDEPDEVFVVKKALVEHLDMDPRATLSVLCDQLAPPEEDMDEEEQTTRDRLRNLVLLFLTGEAKRAIVERHALPGSDVENMLLHTSHVIIPKLGLTDVEIIVRDLLLSLPTFKSGSVHGSTLSNILLEKVSSYLRTGIRSGDVTMLNSAQSCLDLVAFVVITKKAAPAIPLLRFYCSYISTKITLQKFSKPQQSLLICSIAEALAASQGPQPDDDDGVPFDALRRHVVDSCPFLLESLGINSVSGPRAVDACVVLLQACLQRKEQTQWSPPQHLISALGCIDDAIKPSGFPDIQNLLRLLIPTTANAATLLGSKGANLGIPINVHSPKGIDHSVLRDRPSANGMRRQRPTSTSGPQVHQQDTSASGTTATRDRASTSKHQINLEPSSRPPKRSKAIADATPALLKRLGSSSSSHSDSPGVIMRPSTLAQQASDASQPSPLGYSIKGAASKADRHFPSPNHQNAVPSPLSSLLDRLEGKASGTTSGGWGTRDKERP